MAQDKLARATIKYIKKYGEDVIGSGWGVKVFVVPASEMPAITPDPNDQKMAVIESKVGEKKSLLWINENIEWGPWWNDLELTVVHELLHVLFDQLGFSVTINRTLGELVKVVPPQGAILSEAVRSAVEELIDRLAGIIMGRHSGKTSRSE